MRSKRYYYYYYYYYYYKEEEKGKGIKIVNFSILYFI